MVSLSVCLFVNDIVSHRKSVHENEASSVADIHMSLRWLLWSKIRSVHVEFIRNHIRPARDAQGILAVWKTGTTEREGEPTANIV